jgi:hypothetical protein
MLHLPPSVIRRPSSVFPPSSTKPLHYICHCFDHIACVLIRHFWIERQRDDALVLLATGKSSGLEPYLSPE